MSAAVLGSDSSTIQGLIRVVLCARKLERLAVCDVEHDDVAVGSPHDLFLALGRVVLGAHGVPYLQLYPFSVALLEHGRELRAHCWDVRTLSREDVRDKARLERRFADSGKSLQDDFEGISRLTPRFRGSFHGGRGDIVY